MENHPSLTPAYLKKMGIKEEDRVSIFSQWVPDFPNIFQSLESTQSPTWVMILVTHQQHLQEAKKAETRINRASKVLEALLQKRKNRI
jgi:hypothetical protein